MCINKQNSPAIPDLGFIIQFEHSRNNFNTQPQPEPRQIETRQAPDSVSIAKNMLYLQTKCRMHQPTNIIERYRPGSDFPWIS